MLVATLNSQICSNWDEAQLLMERLSDKELEHTCSEESGGFRVYWAQIEDKPDREPAQQALF